MIKVKMKQLEKWCLEYAERWNKKHLWDSFTLITGAWIDGYQTGCTNHAHGEELVEVELHSNQIGQNVPVLTAGQFKKEMAKVYRCEDIRVDIKDGLVSFQGTFKI